MAVVAWMLVIGTGAQAQTPGDAAAMRAFLSKLVVTMDDPDPAVREEASVRLKNLPLQAYPFVESFLAERKNLSPEQRARIETFTADLKTLATRARQLAALQTWERKAMVDAYRSSSDTNPKWDPAAIETIEKMIDALYEKKPAPDLKQAVTSASGRGCEDPVFLYYATWYYCKTNQVVESELDEMHGLMQQRLRQYPPLPACMVQAGIGWIYTFDLARLPRAKFRGRPSLQQAAETFQKIGGSSGAPPEALYRLAEMILHAANREAISESTFQRLAQGLDEALPGSVYGPVFRGWFATVQANGAARAIDERFRTPMQGHVQEAEKWLEKAWQIDPTEARSSTFMLRLYGDIREQGMGQPVDDASYQKWFERAMKANPDNYEACLQRLEQLLAGDEGVENATAFAEECRRTQNWRGRLPFIVGELHARLSVRTPDRMAYNARPEVWQAIRGVFAEHLRYFPDDTLRRSYFALSATQCRAWRDAHELFQQLGDKPDLKPFGSMESYNYLRRKAARLAGQTVK